MDTELAEEAPLPPDQPEKPHSQDWKLPVVLALLVAFLVLRSLIPMFAPRPDVFETATTRRLEALRAAKVAYYYHQYFLSTSKVTGKSEGRRQDWEKDAITKRYAVGRSKAGVAGDWRRLGITVFLFHWQDGLASLRYATKVPESLSPPGKVKASRHRFFSEQADALPNVPKEEELALWEAIYGPNKLTQEEAKALLPTLRRLKLGWYEHVATAHLYHKAGLFAEEELALEDADASTEAMATLQSILWFFMFVGFLSVVWLSFLVVRRQQQATSASSVKVKPFLGGLPPPIIEYFAPLERGLTRFSYRARIYGFVTYMAAMLLIGVPFIPIKAMTQDWSSEALVRLHLVLNLVLYVPVVGIALWVLRRMAKGEGKLNSLPTLRSTLAALGFRVRRPLVEWGVSVWGYGLAIALMTVAALISDKLFRGVYTPENDALTIATVLHTPLDRFLLFVVVVMAAPIVEELMFRGVFYRALRERWGVWPSVAMSAAIFAIVHPNLPGGFLPLWSLGAVFALTYERRSTLLPCILMHSLHNALVTLLQFAVLAS